MDAQQVEDAGAEVSVDDVQLSLDTTVTSLEDAGPLDASDPDAGDLGAGDLDAGDSAADGAPEPDVGPWRGGPSAVSLAGATTEGDAWLAWEGQGAAVDQIFGPQGGYHIWVSFCVPSAFGETAEVEVSLWDEQAGVATPPGLVKLNTALKEYDFAPGQRCRLGIPAFLSCACQTDKRLTRVRLSARPLGSKVAWSFSERLVRPIHGGEPCVNLKTFLCQAWGGKLK